jgi:hypothetical protein
MTTVKLSDGSLHEQVNTVTMSDENNCIFHA